MKLRELLTEGRVAVAHQNGRQNGASLSKGDVLRKVAHLLAEGAPAREEQIHRVLEEREALQSTGIGEGVAIPHGSLPDIDRQIGAVLTLPEGVAFDSIDDADVHLVVALVSPKRESGEHLKTLARISRILRSRAFRDKLVHAPDPSEVYRLLLAEDEA